MRIFKWGIAGFGILLLINTVLLSIVSNFNLGLILQGVLSLSMILYVVFWGKLHKGIHIAAGVVCMAVIVFIGFLFIFGSTDNAKYDEDVVIVLGAGIHGEQVSVPLSRRLDEAVEYNTKNPGAIIVVCGGQGFQEDITEALAMERYLVSKCVPQEKILKEEKSTSTYENFLFAREILGDYFPQGFSAILITNDFHVYRAAALAQYAGISAGHIGAYTEWYTLPVNYLREMLAVLKMWVIPPQAIAIV